MGGEMNLEDLDENTLYITPDKNNVIFNGEVLTERFVSCEDCGAMCYRSVYINLSVAEEELERIKEAGGCCGICASLAIQWKAFDELRAHE
jgi:heterodisulfide reductase subunit A-like polyferredoxin